MSYVVARHIVKNGISTMNKPNFNFSELFPIIQKELEEKYPQNKDVKAVVRRELQGLRDAGYLNFVSKGKYSIQSTQTSTKGFSNMKKSINWFLDNRPELCEHARSTLTLKRLLVCMSVKAGKKEFEIISAVLDINDPTVNHIHITNMNRRDCIDQRQELKRYSIAFFAARELPNVITHMEAKRKQGVKTFFVHFDESDFGTGNKQLLGKTNIFADIWEMNDVFIRGYSATNEEAAAGGFVWNKLDIPDHPDFYGPNDYLDNNKVIEAVSFWNKHTGYFSDQGKNALDDLHSSDKTFGVVRITGGKKETGVSSEYNEHKKPNSHFRDELKKIDIRPIFVDKDNSFYWGFDGVDINGDKWKTYDESATNPLSSHKYLIVINQTATRSTHVGFHDRIAFWHDYRGSNTSYNTYTQAILRVNHYTTAYDKPVDITVYGDLLIFECAAKRIPVDETGRKASHRISNGETLSKDKSDYTEKHYITEDAMISEAKTLGCNVDRRKANEQGKFEGTIRVTKIWTKNEIEIEKFWGLSIGRTSFRTVPYYDNETLCWRLIIHYGKAVTTSTAKKSIFT